VASRFNIGRVVVSEAFRNDADMLNAFNEAGLSLSQVTWVSGVSRTTIGEMQVEIVAPPWHDGGPTNDASLFVRVDAGAGSLVVDGDAPIAVEDAMGSAYDFDVQILKAGHHGSKNSTSAEWLGMTSPEYVVASCGRRNTYGHPAPAMIERVREYGAKFLRTDRDGTVEFVLGPSGFVPLDPSSRKGH
jgi:competence protein ComEC